MSQHHATTTVNNQEEHHGVMHKIADKLGIHKKDHHKDSKLDKHGARDNETHHHKNNDSPSTKEKIKNKLGMHTDEKMTTDHHHKKTEGAPLVGTTTNPHGHHHGNVGGMNTAGTNYTTGQAHTSGTNTSGVPSTNTHGHDNLNTLGTNYTSGQGHTSSHTSGVPSTTQHGQHGVGHDNMNTTGSNYSTGQSHTSSHTSGVPSTTQHGQHGLGHDNMNTTGSNYFTGQGHTSGRTSGVPSSNTHGLGRDNAGDYKNPTEHDTGKVESLSTSHGYQQGFQTDHRGNDPNHDAQQYNIPASPGFVDDVKTKHDVDMDYHKKKTEGTNLYLNPSTNTTNPHDHGHANGGDVNSPSRGFGADQPLTHIHQEDNSHSHLPKSTPQAEAGSIYSSSVLDNSPGSAMTGDNNRQGYSTSDTRDTGNTSGRM